MLPVVLSEVFLTIVLSVACCMLRVILSEVLFDESCLFSAACCMLPVVLSEVLPDDSLICCLLHVVCCSLT